MERFVFDLRWVFCLSTIVSVLSAIAIEVFGAPLSTCVLAPFALMVIVMFLRGWYLDHGPED